MSEYYLNRNIMVLKKKKVRFPRPAIEFYLKAKSMVKINIYNFKNHNFQ